MMIEAMRRAFGDTNFTAPEAALVLGTRQPYSTLTRLKQAGVLERLGRGQYRFAPLGKPTLLPYLEREGIRATRADREEVLSALARKRWAAWTEQGFVTRVGERRFRVTLRTGPPEEGLRVRRKNPA